MGPRPHLSMASNTLIFTEKRPKCPDPGVQLLHKHTKVPPDKARKKGNLLLLQC